MFKKHKKSQYELLVKQEEAYKSLSPEDKLVVDNFLSLAKRLQEKQESQKV